MANRAVRRSLAAAMVGAATALSSTKALGICTLLVTSGGTLTPNMGYTQLSSSNSGGSAGTVTATVVGGSMTLQLTGPANFTGAPSGGNANVTLATQYSTTGATSIGLTSNLSPRTIAPGLTMISIQLSAAKSTGTFPSGSYSADVTVNCS